jgi:hypothetical protein
MINCKKTYLAESKSLGFQLAGVNRGVGTYQALLPWVSEISQFAVIQHLCPAGQTASTKGGEECRRAHPRHGYSSPEVAWFIPTKLEANNDERYHQKVVWSRSPERSSKKSALGVLGRSIRTGCRVGNDVRNKRELRGNDGARGSGLRGPGFIHDRHAQPAGRPCRAVGRHALRWNVRLDRSHRASQAELELVASHNKIGPAAAIPPEGTLKMPCIHDTVSSQLTIST